MDAERVARYGVRHASMCHVCGQAREPGVYIRTVLPNSRRQATLIKMVSRECLEVWNHARSTLTTAVGVATGPLLTTLLLLA